MSFLDAREHNIPSHSAYLPYHPGGVDILLPVAGRDCSSEFRRYHGYLNGHALLSGCYVGPLEGWKPLDPLDESEDDSDESSDS